LKNDTGRFRTRIFSAYQNLTGPSQLCARWGKNDHIGFEITYWFKGIIHKFRPDYLVRLTNGKTVILEVKVQDDQQQQTKREFLSEWVRAVNGHGSFGEWTADVSRPPPKSVLEIVAKQNAS
jgi:type III restriction enzyme